MTAAAQRHVATLELARMGFNDGWLLLPPSFLNFQRPALLVDAFHVGDAAALGLEVFGGRRPDRKLPVSRVLVKVAGHGLSLWAGPHADVLLASTWYPADEPAEICSPYLDAVLLVGQTYAIECSWTALWRCGIGSAQLLSPDSHKRTGLLANCRV